MELDLLQPAPTPPSVLLYARSHGLCSAYDREPVPALDLAPPLSRAREPCCPDTSDVEVNAAAAALLREKMRVNAEAAKLLRCVVQGRGERGEGAGEVDAWERVRALRIEVPVLRTDVEMDLVRFREREGVKGRVELLGISSEKVDGLMGEELEWPAGHAGFAALWDERVSGEKLRVSAEAMRWLQEMRCGLLSDAEWERCRGDVERDAAKPVGCEWLCEDLTEDCRSLLHRGV